MLVYLVELRLNLMEGQREVDFLWVAMVPRGQYGWKVMAHRTYNKTSPKDGLLVLINDSNCMSAIPRMPLDRVIFAPSAEELARELEKLTADDDTTFLL